MILAVTGVGTGVGKTSTAVAIVRALRSRRRVGAWKPIETGGDADGRALAAASGADAGPTILLSAPVSPNVAARLEGRTLDLTALAVEARRRAAVVDILVLEPPGGLYSPVSDEGITNADWLRLVNPDVIVLVASNRLGVLHDVEASRRAAVSDGLRIDAIVLTGGDPADLSCRSNAEELRRRLPVIEVPALDATAALEAWLSGLG